MKIEVSTDCNKNVSIINIIYMLESHLYYIDRIFLAKYALVSLDFSMHWRHETRFVRVSLFQRMVVFDLVLHTEEEAILCIFAVFRWSIAEN